MQGESLGKGGEQAQAFYSSLGRGGRFSPRGHGMECGDNQQNRLNIQFSICRFQEAMVNLEAGGAREKEVDGRIKDLVILVFCVIIVAK